MSVCCGVGRPGHRSEPAVAARELDQRRRARGVVVRAGPDPGVVAVGEDEDRVVRRALDDGDEVLEPDAAEAGDASRPRCRRAAREAVERELVLHPAGLRPPRRADPGCGAG